MVGRSILFKVADSTDIIPLGISMVKAQDGQPTPSIAAKNLIAVCQDSNKFVASFKSDIIGDNNVM